MIYFSNGHVHFNPLFVSVVDQLEVFVFEFLDVRDGRIELQLREWMGQSL